MKVYLKRKRTSVSAIGEYDIKTKALIVKKESVLSGQIRHTEKFRGAKSIEKLREGVVDDNGVLKEDMYFKSASTAANFVTGSSTNGLVAWKDENGKCIKEIISE